MHIYIYMYKYVCTRVYIYIYMYENRYICVCVCMRVCVCVYVNVCPGDFTSTRWPQGGTRLTRRREAPPSPRWTHTMRMGTKDWSHERPQLQRHPAKCCFSWVWGLAAPLGPGFFFKQRAPAILATRILRSVNCWLRTGAYIL